jgi:hypothetical protein
VRAFIVTLILSLMMWGCFGTRTSRIDSSDGGDDGKIDHTGSGGREVVARDASGDGSSSGYCGDRIIQYWNGEQCDRGNLGGESCRSLYGEEGELSCTVNCRFNDSMCYSAPTSLDGGRRDGGSIIRDAGRDVIRIIDIDDAGEDDGERIAVSGGCVRSTGAVCESDSDCQVGGCGQELCYNPDIGELYTPCDCQSPANLRCGCVNGGCSWWY